MEANFDGDGFVGVHVAVWPKALDKGVGEEAVAVGVG